MQAFEYRTPKSLKEVQQDLKQFGSDAKLIAGGTALMIMMKQRLVHPGCLISLRSVRGLAGIAEKNGGLAIGGATTHRAVESSPLVKRRLPLLAETYHHVATVRVRNMATVGGGLAHADPSQDPPAGFIALDARVKLTSKKGERTVPVQDLFRDYYETVIEPGELLTEVIVPRQPANAKGVYLKFLPRTEDDYATVAVGLRAEVQGNRCSGLRVALVAAGPTAIRAEAVERELEGTEVTPASIRRAAEAVEPLVDPLDDFRGSAEYKRDMAIVFTRRALERVFRLSI